MAKNGVGEFKRARTNDELCNGRPKTAIAPDTEKLYRVVLDDRRVKVGNFI